jgi:hypothetical protein
MFSFLNDKELYGAAPTDGPQAQQPLPRAQPPPTFPLHLSKGNPPPQSVLPAPAPDVVLKGLSALDQRIFSLEDRLVSALERSSLAEERRLKDQVKSAPHGMWSLFFMAVAASLLTWMLMKAPWRRAPAYPEAVLQHPPYVIQGLPPLPPANGAGVQLPPPGSTSTPVLFAAPTSFLPR